MIDIDNLQGIIEFQMESDFKRLRSTCGTSMEDNASSLSFGDTIELITRLREAERDAARYRFMRNSGKFLETGVVFDAIVDQAMKEKCDE